MEIGPDAERDITSIREYIARDKPLAANKWVQGIRQQIRDLRSLPELYEIVPELADVAPDYRHMISGNYRVIFRVESGRVLVLRVIHAGQLLQPSMLADS